jgi:hypothetical protein
LLYFLFIVATHLPGGMEISGMGGPRCAGGCHSSGFEASSGGVTDLHGIIMALRPQGLIPSGRHWMLPIELHKRALGQILQPLYLRIEWELLS